MCEEVWHLYLSVCVCLDSTVSAKKLFCVSWHAVAHSY